MLAGALCGMSGAGEALAARPTPSARTAADAKAFLDEAERRNARRGLVSICAAGGMAGAFLLTRD